MTVCLQELIKDKVVNEWAAVSSVTIARHQFSHIKALPTIVNIIQENKNAVVAKMDDGFIHKFQIVNYFTKLPI